MAIALSQLHSAFCLDICIRNVTYQYFFEPNKRRHLQSVTIPAIMTLSTSTTTSTVWIQTKTRFCQRHGDHAPDSRCQSRSPKHTKKPGKRGGKRTSGCGGLRRNMTKSERLSRKYFRICSWNCASASRWGPVLEILAYDVTWMSSAYRKQEHTQKSH